MKRPKKLKWETGVPQELNYIRGYNRACDNWEKFLPGEEEIEDIINNWGNKTYNLEAKNLAKAIHERLHHIADTGKKVE